MNTLRKAVTDYIAMRRALGFKLRAPGVWLPDFVAFLEQQGAPYITTQLALEWAQQPASAQQQYWAQRLSWVRGFARYQSAMDARTEIPPVSVLPYCKKRARPYLYTDEEIEQLLQAALDLETASLLKRRTYYCFLGLLAVSGMRISEAIGLKVRDVDLNAGVLTVEGKLGKPRLVPLHASTQKVLSDYKLCRDEFLNGRPADYFFISTVGKRLHVSAVHLVFYELSRKTGLRGPDSKNQPRIHDFRHRFAVQTLLQWYRSGEDVERRLPLLSTYLGHVEVTGTYWYLTACPELMGQAVKRLEQRWEANQ